jgi:hypothetical protein
MLAEGLAMQKTLLQEDPEGYPEVMSLREPIQPQRGENCVVCVHARRKRGDDYPVEVLVEWSSPPPPSPRLTWILLSEARRLAPPEVSIFEARERDGGPANARERKYRSNAGAAEEAARASAAEVARQRLRRCIRRDWWTRRMGMRSSRWGTTSASLRAFMARSRSEMWRTRRRTLPHGFSAALE